MPFKNNVTLQDAKTGSIPLEEAAGIITEVKKGSSIMRLAKEIPMSKPIKTFTYMTGVGAYWVSETDRIETSKPTFVQAEMRAHKLGVIIPTSKENINYSIPEFFQLMQPEIAEAFMVKFDQACFTGADSPFTKNIVKSAEDSDQVIKETKNKYNDINKAIGLLEDKDDEPNGIATIKGQRQIYRATVDSMGRPIFNEVHSGGVSDILGLPVTYVPKTAFTPDIAELVGDWNNAYYSILRGIEYEILDQATLTTVADAEGNPISLAERDMIALKATMSLGFMVVKDDAFVKIEKDGKEKPETETRKK